MWNICHYLFVPVRLNHDSIPTAIKITSLRKWLTIIFTIPFYDPYASKYSTTIKKTNIINQGKNRFAEAGKIETVIRGSEIGWVINIISESYNPDHFLLTFIRMFMHISLLSSIEILKKYNPTIYEYNSINPSYDGSWIISLDPMYCDQLFKISSLTKYLEMK